MTFANKQERRFFVHLAYMDDSGTRDNDTPYQVLSAVVIEDRSFMYLQTRHEVVADLIVPEEKWEQFKEFKAMELYRGRGAFDGISEEKRFWAIKDLIAGMALCNAWIVYGAVDKKRFDEKPYGGADTVDVCFRLCLNGIENQICKLEPPNLVLLVADDWKTDRKLKESIQLSFKRFRMSLRKKPQANLEAWHFHDDMYFGDSKESIGIQTADLCSYFILQHLKGTDSVAEEFYRMFENRIVHSQIEPK